MIQVSYNIEDEATFKREKEGLMYAGKKPQKSEGTIVSFDSDEDELIENGFKIKIMPAYKLLLEEFGGHLY